MGLVGIGSITQKLLTAALKPMSALATLLVVRPSSVSHQIAPECVTCSPILVFAGDFESNTERLQPSVEHKITRFVAANLTSDVIDLQVGGLEWDIYIFVNEG